LVEFFVFRCCVGDTLDELRNGVINKKFSTKEMRRRFTIGNGTDEKAGVVVCTGNGEASTANGIST
jgi:hypothetical protein